MNQKPFKAETLVDYVFDFSKGVNNGVDYTLLPKDQLSSASNTTVRGSFVGPRPCVRKINLTAEGYSGGALLALMASGRFQGAAYFNPDSGTQSLMASIGGHLYRFAISGDTAAVTDVSIPGDLNDASQMRNWLWQAEKWMIVTDGTYANPIFYDGTSSRRSNYGSTTTHQTHNTNVPFFTIPAIGASVDVDFADVTGLSVGDTVTILFYGDFAVQGIAGLTVTLLNLNAGPVGTNVGPPIGVETISWVELNGGDELPPGRVGAYGLGRNWMSLVDGKQFIGSDIVGGSSGTIPNAKRDAVLRVTENTTLNGGGFFAVPGSPGEIKAMIFTETMDSSLGQGPLQVCTSHSIFSCNTPSDRTTWQDLTNPILTESAKGGGGLSQWSTINGNSDVLSRDVTGIRSLVLTRREFNTWGNVPISREIQNQLNRDSEDLLAYTSAVMFDNRHLLTTEGEVVENRGVIWKRLTATNYETISSLQGKAPAVYDALYWEGLNIFQILKGDFDNVERCFAFTLNRKTNEIELWEVLKSSAPVIYDDVDTRIVWSFDLPRIDFGQMDPRTRQRLRLGQSEISVNDLRGKVSFQIYYRPEFWPCWVPWCEWEECSDNEDPNSSKPSYRPVMGLPEPDPHWFDCNTNRPLREAYFFQVRVVVTGHCRVTSMKFTADVVPQPAVAPPVCSSICPPQ